MNISRLPSGKWKLDYYVAGKRKRRFFSTKADAEAEANSIGDRELVYGDWWAALSKDGRNSRMQVLWEIDQSGEDPRQVWEAHKQAGRPILGTVTLCAAIDALLDSRRAAKRRETYLTSLRQALEGFARGREEAKIADITPSDVEAWLPAAAGSRSTYINRLNTLFSFALRREWISKNPVAALDKPTIEYVVPKILAPEEAKRLLDVTRETEPDLLPWVCLGMLVGLRPEEADLIEWDSVIFNGMENSSVRVSAASSKVRHRRIVHLLPSAVDWMVRCRESVEGIPLSRASRRRAMRRLRKLMGWAVWPKDILRHTAASYLIAHHQDIGRVAKELGNSPGVLQRHYQELVTKEDAEKFWAIRP